MKNTFSIGEAAKSACTTAETLRHYDRIGLVKPSQRDPQTGYRYYSEQDIVRLHTVRALQQMDLPLRAIQEVLEYDNLEKVIDFLAQAEKQADQKIANLQYGKRKIQTARAHYENKLRGLDSSENPEVKRFSKRVILLSDTLTAPSIDNLWNYLGHFYDALSSEQREAFAFEDLAGIYTERGESRLFAVCIRHGEDRHLKQLPEGEYLCQNCTEENRMERMERLTAMAKTQYHAEVQFTVEQIVLSGILQWTYQIQIPLFDSSVNSTHEM